MIYFQLASPPTLIADVVKFRCFTFYIVFLIPLGINLLPMSTQILVADVLEIRCVNFNI